MRHAAHVIPVILDGYRCCSGEVHHELTLKDDTHVPCPHGQALVIEQMEEACHCDE